MDGSRMLNVKIFVPTGFPRAKLTEGLLEYFDQWTNETIPLLLMGQQKNVRVSDMNIDGDNYERYVLRRRVFEAADRDGFKYSLDLYNLGMEQCYSGSLWCALEDLERDNDMWDQLPFINELKKFYEKPKDIKGDGVVIPVKPKSAGMVVQGPYERFVPPIGSKSQTTSQKAVKPVKSKKRHDQVSSDVSNVYQMTSDLSFNKSSSVNHVKPMSGGRNCALCQSGQQVRYCILEGGRAACLVCHTPKEFQYLWGHC